DLVGLDTGDKVSQFVLASVKNDSFFEKIQGKENPKWLQHLLDNKWYGRKSKKGFYLMERKADGSKNFKALNLKTLEYEDSIKPKLPSVGDTRKIEILDKRLQTLIDHEAKGGQFLREYFAELFAYSAQRVPEITDHLYSIDDAMRTGYAWDYGPFEYWDFVGLEKGIEIAKEYDLAIADWVSDMSKAGFTSFYKVENGVKKYYDIDSKSYKDVPGMDAYIILENFSHKEPVIQNSECAVHDIGDGVLCVEFRSKSNAIGEGIGRGISEAIDLAESGQYRGVVIGNNAKNFTVGANLMNIGMVAMQKEFDKLDKMVDSFQQLTMKCRYSNVPVVAATQGYVFGGGCEITMHCDASRLAAESYIGLVEVGVGLLPGGGGTKEMAVRASDSFFEGDVQMPTLIEHFKPVVTASVATSAYEAYNLNLMDSKKDQVVVNGKRNIYEAKKAVINMSENYQKPISRNDIMVLGRSGLATLYTAINEFKLGNYMSDYDVEIARKVAYVMCGGDLTSPQKVSEQYLLDIEREGFLSLLGNQKTLDRIQYMLMNNKPLRN
ncbi:MAG: 3-hydroxyacyl-CoA dehydrogenase, partial [Bacteroidia bacterium]|nr:3-hydroxyacyl-CoA dehydrogenase [Bacteroidia bacterium]